MRKKAIVAAYFFTLSVLSPSVFYAQASEPLLRAIDNNDAAAVESLCSQGADPNSLYGDQKSSWSVLHEAVSKGRYEVAAALLRAGADPNAESSYSY